MSSTIFPLREPAWAKVNLALEVLGRRPDGYHEIVSIMQTISLADTLLIGPGNGLEFSCSMPELSVPENLVMRAAKLLKGRFSISQGARMHLHKRIPMQAGLGGGSSDAAAAIRGLNRLWELQLSWKDMRCLGAELGSDVPHSIRGGLALVSGRGEVVQKIPKSQPRRHYLLQMPHFRSSTEAVYDALLAEDFTAGDRTRAMAADPHLLHQYLGCNSLERPLMRGRREAHEALARFKSRVPHHAWITGSGSALVADYPDAVSLCQAQESMRADGSWTASALDVDGW